MVINKQSGEIIATSGHEETVVVAVIDYSKIELQSSVLVWNLKFIYVILCPTLLIKFWKYAGKAFHLTSKRGQIFTCLDGHERQKPWKGEPYDNIQHSFPKLSI